MIVSFIFMLLFVPGIILVTCSILVLKEDEDEEAFHGRNYIVRKERRFIISKWEAAFGGVFMAFAIIFCFILSAAGV